MAQDNKHYGTAPGFPQLLHGQQLPISLIPGCVRETKTIPSPRSDTDQPVHGVCLHGMDGRMDREKRHQWAVAAQKQ